MVSTITQTYLTQQMFLKDSTAYSVLSDNIISTFAPVAMALSNCYLYKALQENHAVEPELVPLKGQGSLGGCKNSFKTTII